MNNEDQQLQNSIRILHTFIEKEAPQFLIIKEAEIVIHRYYGSWFRFFFYIFKEWIKHFDMKFLCLYLDICDVIGITEIREDHGIKMRHRKNCKKTYFVENICDDPDDMDEYVKRSDNCVEEIFPSNLLNKIFKKRNEK